MAPFFQRSYVPKLRIDQNLRITIFPNITKAIKSESEILPYFTQKCKENLRVNFAVLYEIMNTIKAVVATVMGFLN